jgi:hypothetical protein
MERLTKYWQPKRLKLRDGRMGRSDGSFIVLVHKQRCLYIIATSSSLTSEKSAGQGMMVGMATASPTTGSQGQWLELLAGDGEGGPKCGYQEEKEGQQWQIGVCNGGF